MKDATLAQGNQMLNLILQKRTPSEQLQKLLASGLFSDLLEANLENGVDRDAFRRLIGLKPINLPLLETLGTIRVPAIGKFVAREKFVRVTSHKAPINIFYIGGDNFSEWFRNKIEEFKPKTILLYAKLTKYSVDGPIIAELGDTAETTLAEIYALMERQPNGEDGILLTNGYANIFYVRDVKGVLRVMSVDWGGDGWNLIAHSIESRDKWSDGFRVFSRNF